MSMLHVGIEFAMILLFLIVLFDAIYSFAENKKKLLLLILAFVYALVFENLNMYLAGGRLGAYFYSNEFIFFIFDTPLFIALAWASLIYTAMHISDMLNLKTLVKPFLDALLVVLVDLTLDVVAVRQELCTWVGYSHHHGWFGVPADNFIGWLLVVFTFSFLFRYFSRTSND
ncbi:carotenoid biosynthesis protein, partial [Candidatus Woesearchaeota archaeon]|nr:carotenoid biosynthesis protein [Candidatus Woesearchaeota archaeon]